MLTSAVHYSVCLHPDDTIIVLHVLVLLILKALFFGHILQDLFCRKKKNINKTALDISHSKLLLKKY